MKILWNDLNVQHELKYKLQNENDVVIFIIIIIIMFDGRNRNCDHGTKREQ